MPTTIIILLLIVVVVAIGWKLLQARRGNDTPTAVPHLHKDEAQEVGNALRKQAPPPPVSQPRLDGAQVAASAEFRRLIAAGLRIEAIKYYHAATGCGLAEAKAALDKAVEEQNN